MNYQLKNISEKDHGTVYELQTGKNLLGRSRSATIRILLDDISGKQCILHSNGLQVKLENLSRFGTRVNNSKVIESVDLVEGDIITLGAKCQLLLEKCPEEPQAVEREMLLVGEKDPLHDTVVDLLPGERPDIPVAAFFPGHTGADEGIKKEPLQENTKTLTGTVGEEATAATRFVEELLQKETPPDAVGEEATAATRFVEELLQKETLPDAAGEEATAATRFVEDLLQKETLPDAAGEEATAATRFVEDLLQKETLPDAAGEEATAATRFAGDLPVEEVVCPDKAEELTAETKFAGDLSPADQQASGNETALPRKAEDETPEAEKNADMDGSWTQFSSDAGHKPAKGFLHRVISRLFFKKTFVEDTRYISDDKEPFPGETAAETFSKSADDVKERFPSSAGDLSGSDRDPGEKSVKESPAVVPAASEDVTVKNDGAHIMPEDPESMEALEEEIRQQRSAEEFFEDEDPGDKTDPDPEDITTFFEDEESESSEKTNVNETQMLQTRIASIDEINYIKDQVKRRQQKRFLMRAAIFASIAFALYFIWHLRAPQQEDVLSWPKNGDKQATGFAVPFEKGWDNGGFDVFYPDCGKRTVKYKPQADTFTVDSFIGIKRNVPVKITISRQRSSLFLEESRKQSFTRLLTEKMKNKKELYTFDKNSSVTFLGSHNGIRCNVITYQKDHNNRSFWGKMYYFRYGDMAYHLTAEVPFDDRIRAKKLLEDNSFIDISQKFEYLYWEGSDDFRRGDLQARIDEIEDDVRRKSPFQISNLERGIRSILIQTTLENNTKLREKGLELLEKLRRNEDELYREYVGKWLLAEATGDTQLKQKIRNVSEGVFSLETDRRRELILQDKWSIEK